MRKIRYAVIGAGDIARRAVLPAFRNAENSELAAVVSGDPRKREELARQYGVRTYSYEQYDECLASGAVDAVYIATPNHLHRDQTERAAKAGVHVLCEKPLAANEEECRAMIEAANRGGVKLMTAYRLHFEEGNLEAVRLCTSGELGEPRFFHSVFGQQVAEGNPRVAYDVGQGGGPLLDMGVYCINAARYLFRDEPVEVSAMRSQISDPRFAKVEEMMSVALRFPHDRLANFTVSFGAADVNRYILVATKGYLAADPAYMYSTGIRLRVSRDGQTEVRTFPRRDQFAAQLVYFSECILEDREPEPDGEEGLIDVQIASAAYRACDARRAIPIETVKRTRRPEPSMAINRAAT